MGGIFAEVADHPVFESLCLTDIDNLTGFILHQVAAGFQRQQQRFRAQFINIHPAPPRQETTLHSYSSIIRRP